MKNNIIEFISLHHGEEQREKVLENVKSNISFRGANFWILACAIVIASVGLNVNSTAVIIGAMLISPLMGPIVGAGFALAIYDFELLKKSAKNLFIATIVSLVVATFYFFISPFKDMQSELLARTSPTFYDVLIAFFGGLVGVIALTRVEKGNPIPGVAIATALMPPLCTAGYGIATKNYACFFGAFYLYTINCFFICISTFFIIKYLKYKPVKILNEKFEKQIRYGITTLMLLMIVPSFYIAYNLLQEKRYSQKVEEFITNEFLNEGNVLIYKQTKFNSNPKKIELAFWSKKFNADEIKAYNKKLAQYNITNTQLEIRQEDENTKVELSNDLSSQFKLLNDKEMLISKLKQELKQYKVDDTSTINEIKILFPAIHHVSIGKHIIYQNTDSAKTMTVVLYNSINKISPTENKKLEDWLSQRMNTANIKLVKEN